MLALAVILLIGLGAQWVAWRLRVPAIVILLATGFFVGPVATLVTPSLFGTIVALRPQQLIPMPVLMQLVSLAVGLILFEGGLSLTFRDIAGVRRVVWMIVTVGALATWAVASLAAKWTLGLDSSMALLLGSVLIVTGPTVIGPLLSDVRPTGKVGSVLRWEGIVIDPIGAMATVLVYEAIAAGHVLIPGTGFDVTLWAMAKGALFTSVAGAGIGAVVALALVVLLAKYWVPDTLRVAFVLMAVVLGFSLSNTLVPESGLFAVTVMGIVLANQRRAQIDQIVEFMESIAVLLLSILFIVLAASIEPGTLGMIGPGAILFVAALVVVARPLSVLVSTIGSSLTWRERGFMCWMAPRGIVAAAVASVFGLRLEAIGVPNANLIAPYVFLVIVSTVILYGLTAGRVARRLKLSKGGNAGFLIVGASRFGRQIGEALKVEGIDVLLVDTNINSVREARLAGLQAHHGNALSAHLDDQLELSGLGRLLALTGSDEVNALACVHYAKHFGKSLVYQLPQTVIRTADHSHSVHRELVGRTLFGNDASFTKLISAVNAGARIKRTRLTSTFTFGQFRAHYGESAIPLFLIAADGQLTPITADSQLMPKEGEVLLSLAVSDPEKPTEPLLAEPGKTVSAITA